MSSEDRSGSEVMHPRNSEDRLTSVDRTEMLELRVQGPADIVGVLSYQIGGFRGVYSRECLGRGGCARIALDRFFAVNFDLENDGEIVEIFVGDEADELRLASVVGFEAARRVFDGGESILVPRALPDFGRLAGNVAVVDRLSRIPIGKETRRKLTLSLVLDAVRLEQAGFEMAELLTDHLSNLAGLLPDRFGTTRLARSDDRLRAAIMAGRRFLDPVDDAWQWYADIAEDLPDEALLLTAKLDATPIAHSRSPLSSEDVGVQENDRRRHGSSPTGATASWFVPRYAKRSIGHGSDLDIRGEHPRVWNFPLYWRLLDEAMRPEDRKFDGAVTVRCDDVMRRRASIEVRCPAAGSTQSSLHARLATQGKVIGADDLSWTGSIWSGSILLPPEFDPETHSVEVTNSLAHPVIRDPRTEECQQWLLLAKAQEFAGEQTEHYWRKVEELSNS